MRKKPRPRLPLPPPDTCGRTAARMTSAPPPPPLPPLSGLGGFRVYRFLVFLSLRSPFFYEGNVHCADFIQVSP